MNKLVYLFLFFVFTACGTSFSSVEKAIIYDSPESPARVLKINEKKDSIILRTPSRNIKNSKKNKDLPLLVKKLHLTLLAENGVGIAAPQIGINRNIFLFLRLDQPGHPVEVAINPKIISHSPEIICFQNDGCLSVPDKYGNSQRYSWIEAEYTNIHGEKVRNKFLGGSRKEDYTGIIFQHEYDHIQGKLYIDKLCEP
ncbi:MAG: peptide deformylase [Flavobacteriaceae bacterium]|jgi:peptide deformylase|nr:peptide deformylase [Flavobacteriaceae bacterium]